MLFIYMKINKKFEKKEGTIVRAFKQLSSLKYCIPCFQINLAFRQFSFQIVIALKRVQTFKQLLIQQAVFASHLALAAKIKSGHCVLPLRDYPLRIDYPQFNPSVQRDGPEYRPRGAEDQSLQAAFWPSFTYNFPIIDR